MHIAYVSSPPPWPSLAHPRQFARRLLKATTTYHGRNLHLDGASVPLIPVPRAQIRAQDVPDADVTIGTWWETMEWIRDWPMSKGLQAYFIRHHEVVLHRRAAQRVEATYRQPCVKLVIAKWLQRLMAERYGDQHAVLIPNGVDWDQFNSLPRRKQPFPTVGMVYHPAAWKGCSSAFAAIRIARQALPDLRVVCFGISHISSRDKCHLNIKFEYRPRKSRIADLYRSTDCWLVPSVSEGFGMPGLEAAACRCPIVATRCGGPEDYVQDRVNGYLVQTNSPEAMAARLVDVLQASNAQWRELSEASYRIATHFNWDHSAELLEKALTQAIGENQPTRGSGERHN